MAGRRAIAFVAVLALMGGLGLTSCSEETADSVDYAVDGTLISYNTNTVAGACLLYTSDAADDVYQV